MFQNIIWVISPKRYYYDYRSTANWTLAWCSVFSETPKNFQAGIRERFGVISSEANSRIQCLVNIKRVLQQSQLTNYVLLSRKLFSCEIVPFFLLHATHLLYLFSAAIKPTHCAFIEYLNYLVDNERTYKN